MNQYREQEPEMSNSKICCWLLSVAPILHMYKFISIITLGELAIIICFLLCFKRMIKVNAVFKNTVILVVYFFSSSILSTIVLKGNIAQSIKEFLPFVIYYILFIAISQSLDVRMFLNTYMKIAQITAIFVIVQFIAYSLFNISIPGLIPNIETYAGSLTNYYFGRNGDRCAGFFTEPAMCARYLAIPLFISMVETVKSGKFICKSLILYTIAITLTFSGNAIIAVGLIYLFYGLLLLKQKNTKALGNFLIMLFIGGVVVFYLLKIPRVKILLNRVNEIGGNGQFSSGYIRMVRGYVAYYNLPFLFKIIGVGFGNYELAIQRWLFGVLTQKTDLVLTWLNGFQTYLIYGGFLGAFLYLRLLFRGFKTKNAFKRFLLILMIVYLFVAGFFAEPMWLIFLVLIFSTDEVFFEEYNTITF